MPVAESRLWSADKTFFFFSFIPECYRLYIFKRDFIHRKIVTHAPRMYLETTAIYFISTIYTMSYSDRTRQCNCTRIERYRSFSLRLPAALSTNSGISGFVNPRSPELVVPWQSICSCEASYYIASIFILNSVEVVLVISSKFSIARTSWDQLNVQSGEDRTMVVRELPDLKG